MNNSIFLIIFTFFLILSTFEIFFSLNYSSEITCFPQIIKISISDWLVTKALLYILTYIILLCNILSEYKSILYYLTLPAIHILQFVNLIWNICGMIIYCGECYKYLDLRFSILMFFSLTIGNISIFLTCKNLIDDILKK